MADAYQRHGARSSAAYASPGYLYSRTPTDAPSVAVAIPIGSSTVLVLFSAEMDPDNLDDASLYSIEPTGDGDEVTVDSVEIGVIANYVILTLDGPMSPEEEYLVEVSDDLIGAFHRAIVAPLSALFTTAELEVVPPITATAVGLDSTHVRVTFSVPVVDNEALRCAEAYRITRSGIPLAIFLVTPGGGDDPTYVDLLTEEHRNLGSYSLSLAIFEAAA